MPPDGFSAAHAFTARFRRYPYRLKEESFRRMRLFRYPIIIKQDLCQYGFYREGRSVSRISVMNFSKLVCAVSYEEEQNLLRFAPDIVIISC
jgi:hypothetical protein